MSKLPLPEPIKRAFESHEPAKGAGVPGQPDFLCIGLPRSGTRWLYDILQWEPDFWMPPMKELHYFDNQFRLEHARRLYREYRSSRFKANRWRRKHYLRQLERADAIFLEHAITYDKDESGLDWYLQLFRPKGTQISGDITPAYYRLDREIISAIAARSPQLKIIFLLRDPVARAWSGFNRHLRREISGSGNASLNREQRAELERRSTIAELATYLESWEAIDAPTPADAYQRWKCHFSENQILVEFMDNISNDPEEVRRLILNFLGGIGADSENPDHPAKYNRKASHSKVCLNREIRAFLVKHFAKELYASAETFGGPTINWLRHYGL